MVYCGRARMHAHVAVAHIMRTCQQDIHADRAPHLHRSPHGTLCFVVLFCGTTVGPACRRSTSEVHVATNSTRLRHLRDDVESSSIILNVFTHSCHRCAKQVGLISFLTMLLLIQASMCDPETCTDSWRILGAATRWRLACTDDELEADRVFL